MFGHAPCQVKRNILKISSSGQEFGEGVFVRVQRFSSPLSRELQRRVTGRRWKTNSSSMRLFFSVNVFKGTGTDTNNYSANKSVKERWLLQP